MLKQLLQLLLNTRTTPSEAAHNAAPGRIDIAISGQEYICPADGFVTASATAMNVGGFDLQLSRNGLSVQGGPQEVSVPAWTQAAMIPVAKGDTVNISLYNQNSWQWRFISSIGMGGGKFIELLYGGSVCLRALSNYLPKVFLRAKNSGLAVKHSLKQLLHWMFRHVPSLHRLMGILDTSTLSAVEANSCSIWIRVKKYLAVKSLVIAGFLQQIPTARQQYLSRKAVLLLLLPMRCSIKFGLLRLQARHNLRTGGALC